MASASVPVSWGAAWMLYGIFCSSAEATSISKTTGLTAEPRASTGPPPSLCSPARFFSAPGQSVACVTSTTSATWGSIPTALVRAPPPVQAISSRVVATANTPACLGRSAASSRSASATTYAPMRLSMLRDTIRALGNSCTPASSTAASPTRTRSSASALLAAPMSIHRSVILETLSMSSRFIRWTACLPITPRRAPFRTRTVQACRAVASGRRGYRASWLGRDGCREAYVETAPHAVGRRAGRETGLRADAHGHGGDAHPVVRSHRHAQNGGQLRPRVALHEHEVTERLHDRLPPGPHHRLQYVGVVCQHEIRAGVDQAIQQVAMIVRRLVGVFPAAVHAHHDQVRPAARLECADGGVNPGRVAPRHPVGAGVLVEAVRRRIPGAGD